MEVEVVAAGGTMHEQRRNGHGGRQQNGGRTEDAAPGACFSRGQRRELGRAAGPAGPCSLIPVP